jgi:hypothetical protein
MCAGSVLPTYGSYALCNYKHQRSKEYLFAVGLGLKNFVAILATKFTYKKRWGVKRMQGRGPALYKFFFKNYAFFY